MLIGYVWVSVPIAAMYLSNKLQDTAQSKAKYQGLQLTVKVTFPSKNLPPAINNIKR
jgi:hypothetical protein